ncbi:ABC transporter ATP-binding protein [Nocardia sp. NPDC057668]|uniref:ABC transporter ATP-binding protein n=1 Tax=Nocardia sp. NPDC057668 TaxID=3346202 RepID=UPI0036709A83
MSSRATTTAGSPGAVAVSEESATGASADAIESSPPTAISAETPLLELRGVRAAYGAITVLHGVDLSVAAGKVVALLGPNGAGKTTALRVAAGIHPVTGGDVVLGDRVVTGADPRDLARAGVCLIPEGRGVFPNLSVLDNLLMMTFTGRSRAEIQETAFARFPILARRANQIAGTMSGGEQQMLALARGLATDPAVLLLDELSMGLAPLVVGGLYEQVAEIARQGVAVLVVEQFAAAVLDIADHAAVLVRGRVAAHGRPDAEFRNDLAAHYLGSTT